MPGRGRQQDDRLGPRGFFTPEAMSVTVFAEGVPDGHVGRRQIIPDAGDTGTAMLHAVIMAGGSGTRFWPASRRLVPKQLLALSGQRTMIQSTVDRLGDLIPPSRQMIVTNKILVDAVREQLPQLPAENVVGEPCKRDTAPCVGLAAALVQHKDPDGTMAVMPSDHVIASPGKFQAALAAAEQLIEEDPTRIVTFGIKPTYPAESFGYIQAAEPIGAAHGETADGISAYKVKQFREKPDHETAESYLKAGTYFWNSGIFLWRASTILDAMQAKVPAISERIAAIAASMGTDSYEETLEREFTAIKGTSIDYAVMESYDNVVMIEAPFPWDDVGSWQALSRLNEPDADDNTVVGSHVGIDTKGSIIMTQPGHTVVTIDVEDLIVVQTADATLVAPKHAEERVREAVKALEERGLTDLL
ncbi:Mannose-1-phosphate guanylyltransferase [Rubripirellula lacrimiformis]|uniref:mannose-1-phosphate guanylyltransferase n=2 Tax=Rubripirellula lacrimiformis TaxID=1930273 RepID=A0A517N9U3_9BACT|nr:Mannose-1-phosphate guanylyltransferase [Rubripirellula lacrimiformis]